MIRCLVIYWLFSGASAARKKIDIGSDDGKIIGGHDITITDAPYMVCLLLSHNQICGGAIIDPRYILTAAHCVDDQQPTEISVRVGSTYHDTGGYMKTVRHIIVHPGFSRETKLNDIAILTLNFPITLSQWSKPIKVGMMPIHTASRVTITGWGLTRFQGSPPQQLQSARIFVVEQEKCRRIYFPLHTIPETVFCANYPLGRRGSCSGDSGGPATHQGRLVGIVSWGNICAYPERPFVYTRVSSFVNWIMEETGLNLLSNSFNASS